MRVAANYRICDEDTVSDNGRVWTVSVSASINLRL